MTLIDQPISTIIKAHSTQIAFVSGAAELLLQYFIGSGLPWWAIVALFGAVILGRTVKQPSISGEAKTEEPDYAASV